jgi:hypothetical protein
MSFGDAMVMQESDGIGQKIQANLSGHCRMHSLLGGSKS